jgi:hypothetical protein
MAIRLPAGEDFRADVELLDDHAYGDMTAEQLLELAPEDYEHSFLLIVDGITVSGPQHPSW